MKCHPRRPDFYLYQKDGAWFKTDEKLTKDISARIFAYKQVQIPRMVFYPNWSSNAPQSAKYAAWKVNEFGEQVVRWNWRVKEHSKSCGGLCRKLGDGRCAVKVPCEIEWSNVAGYWAIVKDENGASEAEAKMLDKM